MSEQTRRYIIVGPSWIGDMVMAQSLFITLKTKYPGCIIDVVAPKWSLPILARMPEIHLGIGLSVKHGELSLIRRIKLGMSLRNNHYSHAIVLPRSWKSALLPFFSKANIRTGYRGEMRYGLLNDIRRLDKNVLRQTVQRYVAHACTEEDELPPAVPFPSLTVDAVNRDRLLAELGIDLKRKVICMMPGAEYGPSKQWPKAYYAELAIKLVDEGYQIWILGSAKEKELGETISDNEAIINLCGKTELVDVIDLISCADQVISNDSGLMHVAAAVGVKINVIYGSTTPAYTPPLANAEMSKVFYLDMECSPCFKRECPLGHTRCLIDLKPELLFTNIVADSS